MSDFTSLRYSFACAERNVWHPVELQCFFLDGTETFSRDLHMQYTCIAHM